MVRSLRVSLAGICFVVALSLGFAGTASAEDVVHPSAQASITIPDGWSGTIRDVIQISSAEEDAWIYFWALNASDYEAAIKDPKEHVSTLVEASKVSGKAKKSTLNGLDAATFKGTGKIGDFKVVFHGAIVKTDGSPAIVLIVTSPQAWKGYKDTFQTTIESIRKAKVEQ